MRRRALAMVLKALVAAVALLGLPLAVVLPTSIWQSQQTALDDQVASLAGLIGRPDGDGTFAYTTLSSWAGQDDNARTQIRVSERGHTVYRAGPTITGWTHTASVRTRDGRVLTLTRDASGTLGYMAGACGLVIVGCAVAFGVGTLIALRGSRRIAAPLIYLAAQAEQVGAGQVQVRQAPSGIEEIDLVQEELARSSSRMAGRIAAERQLASDIAHQLRTPLTALSMRIEEISFLSDDPAIGAEAEECLGQIDRLTQVMDDLKNNAYRTRSSARALRLDEVFLQQEREWKTEFAAVGRDLVFVNEAADRLPVATSGSLSQALATLIENALRYGAGTVSVTARCGQTSRSLFIEVSDEGEGVSDELAPEIFRRGVSGHGSTGIGLALAKDLVEADGGRLELTRRRPPVFTISLTALSASLDPNRVMPKGAVVSVGRRARRI
ncbi:HAMP domain-containing histidine kinase [Nanchangia anserum]|uniref:histidine kinase n=1 Tax=Nanchangia anserum TaxID=2692125 RepID=A0A8I0KP85_9ACTO|nr:HAMP domain-containing sensor histidine kinase [Nanchangia anserum]MBD3690096.1 HAMP domain-containing histidine kinase [Nanchangia anserum]QOX82117.1 HAMP domain-containing histidine kinase [Nanchangia anserum]